MINLELLESIRISLLATAVQVYIVRLAQVPAWVILVHVVSEYNI